MVEVSLLRSMQTQTTQTNSSPTAIDLLEQFVETDAYGEIDCELQVHIQEAILHLLECERKTAPFLGTAPGIEEYEAAAEEIRAANLGEFANDTAEN